MAKTLLGEKGGAKKFGDVENSEESMMSCNSVVARLDVECAETIVTNESCVVLSEMFVEVCISGAE